ncbi:MAG: hypothetical protein J0L60_15275 [Ignavibacteria bacterium]|nr:hypothetical protein [Ignavibacteria bacterium]
MFPQKVKPTEQSNPKLSYEDFITGFKSVWVEMDELTQSAIDQGKSGELVKTFKKYFSELGLDPCYITSEEKNELSRKASTSCTNVNFRFNWVSDGFEISDIFIHVSDCNGLFYKFIRKGTVKIDFSLERTLLTEWRKLLNHKRATYDPDRAPQLIKGTTGLTESEFRKKLDKEGAKDIEGVYELMKEPGSNELFRKLRIGIEKMNEREYRLYYYSGALHKSDWLDGEFKGDMTKTGKKDYYKVSWKRDNKTTDDEVFCSSAEQGMLSFSFIDGDKTVTMRFLKLYPVF